MEDEKMVTIRNGVLHCGTCDRVVNFGDNYCSECGEYLDFKDIINQ